VALDCKSAPPRKYKYERRGVYWVQ
jgi:hypothetical protein